MDSEQILDKIKVNPKVFNCSDWSDYFVQVFYENLDIKDIVRKTDEEA